MRSDSARRELVVFIKNELAKIERLKGELKACRGDSPVERRAQGSILHDFYNACERIFEAVAREVNGGAPSSAAWHKKLLYQMTLSVPGSRPSVITAACAARLDDYLAFRHVFRNIYGFELEGERLERLLKDFSPTARMFKEQIRLFLRKL